MTVTENQHREAYAAAPAPRQAAAAPISAVPAAPVVPPPTAPPDRPVAGAGWGYAGVAIGVVLGLVVLAQAMLISKLDARADRLAADHEATKRSYERRLDQLEDRADALTERVKRSLDSAAVARHALPSVFRVQAGRSGGTAFAVAAAPGGGTYLLTNYHVVDELKGSKTVRLERDGERLSGTVVDSAASKDVALIETDEKMPLLRFAATPPRPGQPVVAVGAPGGLEDTVTTGVVSKIRSLAGRDEEYIQFDAAINPGNSGGPVLNAGSRVVGMATAKATGAEGIGFALPIGVACEAFDVIC